MSMIHLGVHYAVLRHNSAVVLLCGSNSEILQIALECCDIGITVLYRSCMITSICSASSNILSFEALLGTHALIIHPL